MPIVAEHLDTVVGVDTHAATHTLAVVKAATGAELERATFPTSPAGLARTLGWIERHSHPGSLIVIEGAGSYGAGLLERVTAAGMPVAEPAAMPARRGEGKSDGLDAVRIARSVLPVPVDRLRRPRAEQGARVAIRVLVVSREQLAADRTRTINTLTALLSWGRAGIQLNWLR